MPAFLFAARNCPGDIGGQHSRSQVFLLHRWFRSQYPPQAHNRRLFSSIVDNTIRISRVAKSWQSWSSCTRLPYRSNRDVTDIWAMQYLYSKSYKDKFFMIWRWEKSAVTEIYCPQTLGEFPIMQAWRHSPLPQASPESQIGPSWQLQIWWLPPHLPRLRLPGNQDSGEQGCHL